MAKTKRKSSTLPRLTPGKVGKFIERATQELEKEGGAGAVPKAAAAAAANPVTFSCDNPQCIVAISITGASGVTFVSQVGTSLPAGTRTIGWTAKSSPSGQAFNVTVGGGSFDRPIAGTTGPNAGGVRQLTVP